MLNVTSPGTMQVISALPNWKAGIKTTFQTSTTIIESLSGAEERFANFHRPLIKLSFTAVNLERIISGYFRRVFENRGERPVGMPIWSDAVYIHEEAPAGVFELRAEARNHLFPWFRWCLLWSGPFTFGVNAIDSIGEGRVTLRSLTTQRYRVGSLLIPLAYGKMTIPESAYISQQVSEVPIDFTEQAGLTSYGDEAAPGKTGSSSIGAIDSWLNTQPGEAMNQNFEVFGAMPQWGEPKQGAVDDIYFQPLNSGVTVPHQAYKINRRTLSFDYFSNRFGLQYVLRHWEHHDGPRGSFWVPTWTEDFIVAETAQEGATEVKIKNSGVNQMPERYRAFFMVQNKQLHLIRASSMVGVGAGELVRLPDPLPFTILEGQPLSGAIRARFRDDELSVTCLHPYSAFQFSADFIETPDNLEVGNTHKVAYLYRIQKKWETALFCSWHGALYARATIYGIERPYYWRAGDISHGEIELSESMLGEEMELTLNGVARRYLLQDQVEGEPIEIEVYRIDMASYDESNPPEAISIFSGAVIETRVGMRGEVTLTLSSRLRYLQRDVGRAKLQRQCNHILFSDACGLSREDFTFAGNISAVEGRLATVAVTGGIDRPQGYFSGSLLQQGLKKYVILKDLAPVEPATERTMELDIPAALGDCEVVLWCDKTIASCGAKFANTQNYGGCPWLPNNNPLELARNDDTGGKK